MNAFVLCALAVWAADPVPAPAAKWIDLPAGLSYTLTEQKDQVTVRIPLNVAVVTAGTQAAKPQPPADSPKPGEPPTPPANPPKPAEPEPQIKTRIRDVIFGTARPQSLVTKLTVTFEPINTPKKPADPADSVVTSPGPSLLVSAPATDLLPGTYTLLVEFVQGEKTQAVTLSLERPAPKLVSLRSVAAWQQFCVFCPNSNVPGELILNEESRKSAVRGLTITQVRTPPTVPGPETGSLKLPPNIATVPLGEDLTVPVNLEGNFPLGKTTGKLRINSPDLAAPVIVDYEVTAKRTPILIAVCAIVGALVGWISRILLQSWKESLAGQVAASTTLESLRKAKTAIPDEDFRQKIAGAEQALENLSTSAAAAVTKAVVDAATKDLADATSDLNVRKKALTDRLLPLSQKLHYGWQLPVDAAAKLSAARTLAGEVVALADAHNIKAATTKFDQSMPGTMLELFNTANDWRHDAGRYLDALAATPPAASEQGTDQLKAAITAWKNLFGTTGRRFSIDEAGLESELTTTHNAFVQARSLVQDLTLDGVKLAMWVQSLFPSVTDPTVFQGLIDLADAYAGQTLKDLETPASHGTDPSARQIRQRTQWATALKSILPAGTDATPLTAQLDAGKWATAATEAKRLATPPAPANQPLAQDAVESVPPESTVTAFRGATVLTSSRAAIQISATPRLVGTPAERQQLSETIKWISGVQSAIYCGLFIMIAYGVYLPHWVGTPLEMLGIFAWAYGIDLTADALAPLLKKVATPGSAG